MSFVRRIIRSLLQQQGYALVKHHDLFTTRSNKLFHHHGISLVLDVGANTGQYATGIRRRGYSGKIISFEPLTEAYQIVPKGSPRPLFGGSPDRLG